MDWKWIKDVVDAAVNLVDKAVPVWVGKRTAVAVVLCPLLGVAKPFIKGFAPQVAPAVDILDGVLCSAAPVFAAASLLRK